MQKLSFGTNIQPFEEVYKSSYSHGLESIYRLENIDLKTVRKLGSQPDGTLEPVRQPPVYVEDELELDLGPVFTEKLEPFVLREPIQSLKLARHTEKCLIEQGFRTLGDLKEADLNSLVFVKGLGQGHIVEVREKLASYLGSKATSPTKYIDFISWICEIVGDIETKLAYLILEPYGLSSIVKPTPLESADIKKLSLDKKGELLEQGRAKLAHPDKIKQVLLRFEEIATVLVAPWIASRSGVATVEEIEERLVRCALDRAHAKRALQFLKETYRHSLFLNNLFPFALPCEGSLYFASAEAWGRFKEIERAISAYFWNLDAEIEYHKLYQWLVKDFMHHWDYLDEPHFKKVVAYSPLFERKKLFSGCLPITGCLLIKRAVHYIRD